MTPLKIGSVTLKNNLALAPMAGITNAAFRALCIEGGAGLVVSEMVSAESIKYGNAKSLKLLKIYPSEHPIALQLFGANPESMAHAAKLAEELGADIIDINSGCPVRKVLRSGSGAALMKEPRILEEIVRKTVKAVRIPVTVKIRSGLTVDEVISPRLAKIIADAGAAAITLHGRAASNFHSGPVDYAAFEATAAAVKIPVIGNGGVHNAEDAAKILATGCAGVAIGRASVENPSVFYEINEGLKGGKTVAATPAQKVKLFIRFLELNTELYGGPHGIVHARKLVGYWLKGFPNCSVLRNEFMKVTDLKQAKNLFSQHVSGLKGA